MYYWKGKREQNHHVYSECCHWAPLGDLKLNNAGRNINCTGLRKEQQSTLDWKRELCRLPSASQSFAGTLINRVLLIQKFHSNASLFSVGLQQLQICHWQLRVISCFWVCHVLKPCWMMEFLFTVFLWESLHIAERKDVTFTAICCLTGLLVVPHQLKPTFEQVQQYYKKVLKAVCTVGFVPAMACKSQVSVFPSA